MSAAMLAFAAFLAVQFAAAQRVLGNRTHEALAFAAALACLLAALIDAAGGAR